MILASAQTSPKRFDINANLTDHYNLIKLAAQNGADLILFPELSITGYEREKAIEMAFKQDDPRLIELRKLSVQNNIIVIAGAPIKIGDEMYIGAFVIMPDDTVSIYTKHFLHTGEEVFFQPSLDYDPLIEIKNERISLAICADINNPEHPEHCSQNETTIYLAGIFFEPEDMERAKGTLSNYAEKYAMNVLMSNYSGSSWGLEGGGQSGFWDKSGKLITSMGATEAGLLIVEKEGENWKYNILELKS